MSKIVGQDMVKLALLLAAGGFPVFSCNRCFDIQFVRQSSLAWSYETDEG